MKPNPTPSARASAPARTRRRSPGSVNRAPYRNEVKTRLTDIQYHALQRFRAIHGIDSDSSALARAVSIALLGLVGMLPAEISGVCAEASQTGTHQ